MTRLLGSDRMRGTLSNDFETPERLLGVSGSASVLSLGGGRRSQGQTASAPMRADVWT